MGSIGDKGAQASLFGLSRMYEGFRTPPDDAVRVFRSADEALAWLEE